MIEAKKDGADPFLPWPITHLRLRHPSRLHILEVTRPFLQRERFTLLIVEGSNVLP